MGLISGTKKEDIGLSPDALVFRGERKVDEVQFEVIEFNVNELKKSNPSNVEDIQIHEDKKTTSWLNVVGVHDSLVMQQIADKFHVEQMVLSQVMETNTRPKAQEYDDSFFIALKMLQFDEEQKTISSENLSLVIKDNLLMTFQEYEGDVFDPIRERISRSKKRIRTLGTGYLALALIDVIVDNYSYIINKVGEQIELLEGELLKEPQREILEYLNTYRKDMSKLRRAIHPCRELINSILKTDSDLMNDDVLDVFMRDLQQNISYVHESSETYWVMVSDYLNLYHTVISSRMNDIMKYLTIFSVLFIPATFIVGVYGTNFDNLPEVKWHFGYYIMLGVIALTIIAQFIYFRIKKWL